MALAIPDDPFALPGGFPYQPAAQRALALFGAPVELVWLPSRHARRDAPTARPRPFRSDAVERILRDETLWRGDGCALTPNRHPLGHRELLLWSEAAVREPDVSLLRTVFELEERSAGAVLINSIGAAASAPRAHAHLLGERLAFLEALPRQPRSRDGLPDLPGVDTLELAPPFPALTVGLRGPAPARAAALHRLLELRSAPSFNVVSQDGVAWLFPRSAIEIPAPHFPTALGCSELWGRWFYAEEEPFRNATPADLEAAIEAACWAR